MHIKIGLFNLSARFWNLCLADQIKHCFIERFLSSCELAIFFQSLMLFHKLWSKLKSYLETVWQYLLLKQEAVASCCTEREVCMVGDEGKFTSNRLSRAWSYVSVTVSDKIAVSDLGFSTWNQNGIKVVIRSINISLGCVLSFPLSIFTFQSTVPKMSWSPISISLCFSYCSY